MMNLLLSAVRRYGKAVKNIRLRKKFLFSYMLLIVLPLGLLTALSSRMVSRVLENQLMYSAKMAFEQTDSFINYKISSIINASDLIFLDTKINDALRRDTENYSIPQQLRDLQDFSQFFSNIQKNQDIYQIRLYVSDSLIYAEQRTNFFNLKDAEGQVWYKKLQSGKSPILWCPPSYFGSPGGTGKSIVSAVRLIRNWNNLNEYKGILRIDILESTLNSIIIHANTTKTGLTYIINSEGVAVTSTSGSLVRQFGIRPAYCFHLSTLGSNWEKTRVNGKELIIGSRNIKNTDWFLVSVIPYEEIQSSSQQIGNRLLLLLAVIGTLAYILAVYFSSSITGRISQLIRKMRRVQEGDLNVSLHSSSSDEIGELIDNFNYMVSRMSILIEEQYKTGLEVKNAELKALQAQINPHFLYNTLDAINWMAIKNNVPEICSMVQSLARFYKLSLNKGSDIVTLADEITHVRIYVQIQNKRFDNRITLTVNVPEELMQYSIPKITLQPIVENSILHGILQKPGLEGTIDIAGSLAENILHLEIRDNGAGMSEDKLSRILSNEKSDNSHGYGVKNIHNRLRLYYGNSFGLTYDSIPGKGTRASIRIPARTADPE